MKRILPTTNKDYFKELYDTYFEKLFYFSKKFVKSDDAAQEVLSEVFFSCWKNIEQFREKENIKSYLYTCVKNESTRFLRSKFNDVAVPVDDEEWNTIYSFAVDTYNPENFVLQNELEKVINDTIEELPYHCKMIYKMVKEDGVTHSEVASILDISLNTVKNQIKKALKKIRLSLEQYLADKQEDKPSNAKIITMKVFLFMVYFGLFL